jgi:hypothetical protein
MWFIIGIIVFGFCLANGKFLEWALGAILGLGLTALIVLKLLGAI